MLILLDIHHAHGHEASMINDHTPRRLRKANEILAKASACQNGTRFQPKYIMNRRSYFVKNSSTDHIIIPEEQSRQLVRRVVNRKKSVTRSRAKVEKFIVKVSQVSTF